MMTPLQTLHYAVMQGDADAAQTLADEFAAVLSDIRVPGVDIVRSERYAQLSLALDEFDGRLKLPNLNRVVPLPDTADLPHWDGTRTSLVHAAQSIIIDAAKPKHHREVPGFSTVPEGFVLEFPERNWHYHQQVPWELRITHKAVPQAGYWQAMLGKKSLTDPLLFAMSQDLPDALAWDIDLKNGFLWVYRGVAVPDCSNEYAHLFKGWARKVYVTYPLPRCAVGEPCPASGIWRAAIAEALPEAKQFNLIWRQGYFEKGQVLPDAAYWSMEGELQGLKAAQITWYFIEAWQGGDGAWIGTKPT